MANTKKYVSLDKLSLYDEKIKKVISDGDAASLQSAKDYADDLAVNYDAAGSAASALADAKTYADGKDAAIQAAQKAGYDAAAAAAIADGKAVTAQSEVDALETYVGTIPETSEAESIVAYIQEKTSGIATEGAMTELGNRVGVVEGKVATIEGDYLKAADKTELEGKITDAHNAANVAQGEVDALEQTHATDKKNLEDAIALKADQTALDAVSAVANAAVKQSDYDVKVKALEDEDARIAGLVASEAERAAGVEAGLEERLVEVETFFKTAEGQTIDDALDTLVELQTYLNGEGAVADQMLLDIAANKKAIEDHVATNHDFATADATLKSELTGEINKKADKTTVEGIDGRLTTAEGKITTVEGKVSTLESEMDAVEGAVATKAEQTYVDEQIEALQDVDSGLDGRISALEGKFTGEGSVEDMIGDAKQEAIDAAAEDATSKANAAEAAAKGHADSLNTAMNTRVEALEAIDHDHSNKEELNLIASGDKAKWDEAYTKRHEHSNKTVLDGITAENITTWNTVTSKAAQSDLAAVSDRVTALETWHSNFVEVSEEEINALFA